MRPLALRPVARHLVASADRVLCEAFHLATVDVDRGYVPACVLAAIPVAMARILRRTCPSLGIRRRASRSRHSYCDDGQHRHANGAHLNHRRSCRVAGLRRCSLDSSTRGSARCRRRGHTRRCIRSSWPPRRSLYTFRRCGFPRSAGSRCHLSSFPLTDVGKLYALAVDC